MEKSDIGRRLREIADKHGPRSIATYWGNAADSLGITMANTFCHTFGSPNSYNVLSLEYTDRGVVAEALYGNENLILQPDVARAKFAILLGTNPLVTQGLTLLQRRPHVGDEPDPDPLDHGHDRDRGPPHEGHLAGRHRRAPALGTHLRLGHDDRAQVSGGQRESTPPGRRPRPLLRHADLQRHSGRRGARGAGPLTAEGLIPARLRDHDAGRAPFANHPG